MSFLLAVPSCMPGGLDAQMGMHFGHCDIYTIVEIEDNAIKAVGTRPLMGFQQVGVNVFFAGQYPTVGAAVQAFLEGKLPPFTMDFTCGGGGHH